MRQIASKKPFKSEMSFEKQARTAFMIQQLCKNNAVVELLL